MAFIAAARCGGGVGGGHAPRLSGGRSARRRTARGDWKVSFDWRCCAHRMSPRPDDTGVISAQRRAALQRIAAVVLLSSPATFAVLLAATPPPALAAPGGRRMNRCDANVDADCGSDGVRTVDLKVYPPPEVPGYAVTSRAYLDFGSSTRTLGRVELGLFGDSAPRSAEFFARMCDGKFNQLSYASSAVYQVQRDRRIDLGRLSKGAGMKESHSIDKIGRVRVKYSSAAAEDTLNNDANGLRHDRAGLLSVRKGGGSFEFVITPSDQPDKELDKDHIVIGKVLSGMEVVAKLNALAVTRPTSYRNAFLSAGRAINDYRARAAEDDVYKPLQKTLIKSCGLLQA